MGVSTNTGASLAPGTDQDTLLKGVFDEMNDKGFVLANLDKLASWADRKSTRLNSSH